MHFTLGQIVNLTPEQKGKKLIDRKGEIIGFPYSNFALVQIGEEKKAIHFRFLLSMN